MSKDIGAILTDVEIIGYQAIVNFDHFAVSDLEPQNIFNELLLDLLIEIPRCQRCAALIAHSILTGHRHVEIIGRILIGIYL